MNQAESPEIEPKRYRRPQRMRWILVLLPAVLALFWYGSRAVGFVATHRAMTVGSGSMGPSLLKDDRILFNIAGGQPLRREIWSFHGPKGMTLVKRVIGLPGERIEVAGGKVLINDKPLDEPYLATPMTYTMPPVQLGPKQYFMLGDSRNGSLDSHIWGPLAGDQLIGRAEHRFWPKARIGPVQ